MEQLRPISTIAPESDDGVAALEESSLAAMLARARDLHASERGPFVTRVTVRLRALGKSPPDERKAAADAVLALLDQAAFDGLLDGSGRSAHSAAVEAILALGYPHALGLRPEDLARYREDGGTDDVPRAGWQVPVGAVLVGVGMQGGGYLRSSSSLDAAVGQLGTIGLVGAATYALMALTAGVSLVLPVRSRFHRWATRALVASGLAFGAVLGLTVAQLPADAWVSTLRTLALDEALILAAVLGGFWPRTKRPLETKPEPR